MTGGMSDTKGSKRKQNFEIKKRFNEGKEKNEGTEIEKEKKNQKKEKSKMIMMEQRKARKNTLIINKTTWLQRYL